MLEVVGSNPATPTEEPPLSKPPNLRVRRLFSAAGIGNRKPVAPSAGFRGVAQPGSARRSGRRGRRFESCHPDFSRKQKDLLRQRRGSFFIGAGAILQAGTPRWGRTFVPHFFFIFPFRKKFFLSALLAVSVVGVQAQSIPASTVSLGGNIGYSRNTSPGSSSSSYNSTTYTQETNTSQFNFPP